MATKDPTASLVSKAQAGDRQAFDELVRRYQLRLENQIGSRMSNRIHLRLDVNDVLQETLTCAFESISRFRYKGEESFYRWLGGIAEHVIWNVSQKRSWSELQLVREAPESVSSPSKPLRRDERFDRLEKALQGLSADHRQVLILARIEGLRIKEIARIMDRSPNAVKKLLGRAMIELKRSFGDTESLGLPDRRFELGKGDRHGT